MSGHPTSFVRGFDTFSNFLTLFRAGLRRWLITSALLGIIFGLLWTAMDLGPLVLHLPKYVLVHVLKPVHLPQYLTLFSDRTIPSLLRVTAGRILIVFLFILPLFGLLITRHGGRIMKGERMRGARLTTWEKEQVALRRSELVGALLLAPIGPTVVLAVWLTQARLLHLRNYVTAALFESSSLVQWFLAHGEQSHLCFFSKGMAQPGYYAAASVYAFLKAEHFHRSLLQLGAIGLMLLFVCWMAIDLGRRAFKARQDAPEMFDVAGVPVLAKDLTKHAIFLGAPGSGKSVQIKAFFRQVRAKNRPAIVYDTGEYIETFFRPEEDALFWPGHERSVSWSPLAEIQSEADAKAIARMLVPSSKQRFFVDGPVAVLSEALWLHKSQNKLGNQELIAFFKDNDLDALAELLPGSKTFLNSDNAETSLSVLATVTATLDALALIPVPKDSTYFSISEFIEGQKHSRTFFFGAPAKHIVALAPVLAAMTEIAARAFLSLPQSSTPDWFIVLDEIPSIGQMKILKDFLAQTRKFGVCCLLGVQEMSQLQALYGKAEADAIYGQPQLWLVLRSTGFELERLSKLLGEEEIEEQRESLSMGASTHRDGVNLSKQRVMKRLVLATQIANLDTCAGFLKLNGDERVFAVQYTWKTT